MVARAVEQLVCEALGVVHDWPYFMMLCAVEAMRSGVVFPDLNMLTAMVADAKKSPGVVEVAERILREGARAATEPATSKPLSLVERESDLTEAQRRRASQTATKDAAVKRAHEAGNINTEIARELGYSPGFVRRSLKRQGLTPNVAVPLTSKQERKAKTRWRVARNG